MTVKKKQIKKAKRTFSCSFCYNEGHTINKCNDERIYMLENDIKENAAIDMKINLNAEYLHYYLETYTKEDLLVIGYKLNLNIKSGQTLETIKNKVIDYFILNKEDYSELIKNMNAVELDYFANKVYQMMVNTNNTLLNEQEIKDIMHKGHPINASLGLEIAVKQNEDPFFHDEECNICQNVIEFDDHIITNCDHIFCYKCLDNYLLRFKNNNMTLISCPCCVSNLDAIVVSSVKNKRNLLSMYGDTESPFKIDETVYNYCSFLLLANEEGLQIIDMMNMLIKNGNTICYLVLCICIYKVFYSN